MIRQRFRLIADVLVLCMVALFLGAQYGHAVTVADIARNPVAFDLTAS
jgi:hypothetical protein